MTKNMNKTAIVAIICACVVVFAQAIGSTAFVMVMMLAFLAIMVGASDEDVIPLFLFFMPFATILKLSPTSFSFASVATILVFLVKFFKNSKRPISSRMLIAILGLLVVTAIAKLFNGNGIALSYFMFFGMLVAFPLLLLWTKESVNFEKCILFYSIGIILATVLAFLFENNSNLLEYVRVLEEQEAVIRHCGFYGDPNFYASQIVTAIGGQLLIIDKKGSNIFWNIVLTISLIICGATSLSKSYILCLCLLLFLWLLCQARKGNSRYFKLFVLIMVGVVTVILVTGLFSNVIDQYLLRFGAVNDASSLTTNRLELWKEYFIFFDNNPIDAIIGQGYVNVYKEGVHKGSHNTIIQCIYQFGVVGSMFLLSWLTSVINIYKRSNVKAKVGYVSVLAVACFSMWMGLDFLFFDDFFLTILLFALGLSYVQETAHESVYSII